jgi:two-component system cell cycle sensor histidine kinase/response regulator CckA
MRGSRGIVVLGLLLTGAKLALLPLQSVVRADIFSTLADFGLSLVVLMAARQAARRSYSYARALWFSVALAGLLWAVSFGLGAFALLSNPFKTELEAFWPTTIIFYLVGITFAVPLLLSEEDGGTGIDWLRTLDVTQLAIVTFSAYLVFFYIPANAGLSDAWRTRYFAILFLARNGFLTLGFLYRGWRSQFADLRRLQFQLAGFLAAYSLPSAFYFQILNAWHWPIPLLDFVSSLPIFFLIWMAATWPQQEIRPSQPTFPKQLRGISWAQLVPVIMPVSVLVLATRASTQYLRMAWIAIAASFVCYAGRLFVMQHRQDRSVQQLAALEEKFSKAFRLNPSAITISRMADGMYLEANERWLELMKLPKESVIGKTSTELGIWESPHEREKLVDALRHGSIRNMALNFRMGGRTIAGLVSAEQMDFEGEPLIIASILDVTELKSLTQQLHEAQKMELVGRLAGGVAHDFNNLLTIIKGYSQLALTRGLSGSAEDEMQKIAEATDKAAALIRQLLAFSRRQVLQPRNIAINAIVRGLESMLRRTLGEDIEIVSSLASDLGTVRADPVQIEQIIVNLAINARDAMPGGGKLRFETRNLDLPSSYVERNVEVPPGSYAVLAVADTGEGIPSEHLERIFEPFFTTKEVGRGTGLGLSTVYGIVKQSEGHIWVYSELGQGTTFTICLPRVDQPAEILRLFDSGPEQTRGSEMVLVVEDDENVRHLAEAVLNQNGYQVVAASSGAEALRLCDESHDTIHVLVTDMVMPGISGMELAQQLKARRPGLEVLYMSGYPYFSLPNIHTLDLRDSFLAKPFSPSELVRKVRETLNGAV